MNIFLTHPPGKVLECGLEQNTNIMSNTVTPWWVEEAALNDTADETNVINVSWPERLISVGAGAFMLSSGIHNIGRKPFSSLLRTLAGGYLLFRGASGSCRLYSALGKTKEVRHPEAINIRTSLVVDRPRTEVYNFWRKLENLPLFMGHLVKITEIDGRHSKWEAKFPGGPKIMWTAEIVKDEPGYLLGWQSLPDAAIQNAGKVVFKDTPTGGTELRIIITYRPPAGDIGVGIAKLLNPVFARLLENDLEEFINFMEMPDPVIT